MKKLFILLTTYFLISSCSQKPKEFVTFSQQVVVKDVIPFGHEAYQVEFDVTYVDKNQQSYTVSVSIPIYHPVKVGDKKTYIEWEKENEFGQKMTQSPDLR